MRMRATDLKQKHRNKPGLVRPKVTESNKELSVGVPLARIVPRTLVVTPELVFLDQPHSYSAEKFGRLRVVLSRKMSENPKVIAVTSAAPGEGKSLVSMNLALAFAAGEHERTLILDADLRRPTLEKWLNPRPTLGVSDILEGKVTLDHVVLDLKNSPLKLLPSGKSSPDPVELLSSEHLRKLIEDLREQYDRIIIDTPPAVPFTDADLIGGHCDGFLLVARSGKTPQSLFKRAISLLGSAPVLGTILNDVPNNLADQTAGYEKYYNKYYSKDRT
jgi:capsular exopolysaccharide synthesis family protein